MRRIRLESLPLDTLPLPPLAREMVAGRLPIDGSPRDAASIPRPEERMDPDERAQLARRIESKITLLKPHVAVLDAVRSLAEPGALCVVTGQQPGFLGGPLLSLFKALHAIRLAAQLRETWGTPVVAVFWNHADDHDVAEVHHAYVVNRNLDLQRIGLAGMSSGRQPISRIVLTEETHHLEAIRTLLLQAFHGEAHAEWAVDTFMPREGETLASAFTRSFTEMLGRHGLVVLEPDWIREDLSRALAHVVGRDPRPALEEGARALRSLGHQPAIDPADAAFLYNVEPSGRRALRPGGDGFRYDHEVGSRTPTELAAEIVQSPADWSAAALLRPLVQDLALPVCAYVGGLGELEYHLELGPLRDVVAVPRTPFVPRVSCTLVDPACRVSLEKLGLDVQDVLAGALSEDAGGSTASATSPAVATRLRELGERARADLLALREELSAVDRSLAVNAKQTADQVQSSIDKLAIKAERVHQNRAGKGRRHVRRLLSSLLPRNQPQERVLGCLPFVARFGTDWIDELCAALDASSPRHLVVQLDPDREPENKETP